jgi:hypothetical protein
MKASPRFVVLALAVIGISVGALATLRLAAVVSGTPVSLWLESYPRLLGGELQEATGWQSRAKSLAPLLGDPALMRAQLESCLVAEEPGSTQPANAIDCVKGIDNALQLAPFSGELWLERARRLLLAGEFGEPVFETLRIAYRVAPREGWIASGRVVLGLRMFPLLPSDLRGRVKDDLGIVLTNTQLSAPLVDAYAKDLTLRQAAEGAFAALPSAQMAEFSEMVHDRLEMAEPKPSS